MLSISVQGGDRFAHKLRMKKGLLFDKKSMTAAGLKAIEVIKGNTALGIDSAGRSFKPYTSKYIKYKRERQKQYYTGKVNLSDHGHMLSAMNVKAKTNHATIYFTKPKEALKAKGLNRKRLFFDLSRKAKRKIKSVMEKYLKSYGKTPR